MGLTIVEMETLMQNLMAQGPRLAMVGGAGIALYAAARYGDDMVPWFNVEGGQRGVMYNRISGVSDHVYTEGMHPRWPWFERPTVVNVRTREYNVKSISGSRDLQMINMNVRVLCKPVQSQMPWILKNLGEDYREKVLPSLVHETCKEKVASANATELITQREQISSNIRRVLEERALEYKLIVEDVSITHLQFSDTYAHAVEMKQVAQQEAERSKYLLEKAHQEKKSIVIKAQGEAESAKMIGDAMRSSPGYVQLRRIEAARDIASTVSRGANHIFLSADTLLLNLGTHAESVSGGADSGGNTKKK